MSTAEEKENEDVKTVGGILKLKGNDELKFGLLIGLIELQQATNKDVVDTVLYLLVGGEFDIESNFVIQDPQNILHMLKLLASCPHTLQAEVWSVFIAMLKKSRRNLHACTEVGLIARALDLLLEADEVTADLLIDMLGVLASYSITVKELKSMFALMKARNNVWQRHSTKLISVLRHMPQRQGPDEFFSFPGKKGSHIALPPIKTWPYQSGWTFSCWMRLDPVTGVNVEREKPYLYCFRTSKGVGYSAHFVGGSLVITSMKIKGKGFQHCVKYEFQPRQWYMVTIVHVYNRWSKSEIRCYVDGHISSSGDISWVVSTSDPFDKCFIGSSAEGDAEEMFCGQMSTIYMFSEALLPQQINAMLHLGPGYKSQFRFENEILNLVSDAHERMIKLFEEEVWPQEEFEALYDGKLTSAIVFMYNPIACDSQLCLESSPKGNQSYFLHSPHAMMCQDVKAIITHSIHSTLHSLGGVQILFPLFGQLDMPVDRGPDKPSEVDYTTCANLIGLLGDLIECSSAIQQQMAQNRGFLVISYLLEKSAKEHITPAVLEAFLTLTEFLVELPTGSILLKYLFDNILFNPQLWVHTSVEVQTKLYCYLATEFINNAQIYNSIRRVSAVLQTMHSLKYYYWVVNPLDRSGVQPKATDGPRPSKEEILKLRSFMLLYVKELIIKGHGILEDELQSMLNYLTTLHEDDNLMDVLELLVHLMAEHPSSMVPAFDQKNGVRTVFKLLASQNEDIRLLALRLLGFFLMRSTYRRKQDAMSPHNLFSLLSERLMLHTQNITMSCYNVLFEILTERMSLDNVKVRREEPESTFRIENSAILKVVATMICQSKPTAEVLEVKKTFLSDLTILCNNNKDNRRTVLQMSVWQDWLFSLSYIYPHNSEQQRITDMVMALFKMLLHHAIKFEFGGWRVWIDTLAILHSKVAYEDFKIHMSKMYQQFEQHRADNITDPAEQQRRPISTISGISSSEDRRPPHKSTVKISEVSDLEAEAIKAANGRNDGLESRRKGSEVSDSTENKEVEKRESRREKEVENGDGGDVVVEKKDKGEDVKSIESEAETAAEGKKEESKECEKPATEDHTSEKSQEQNSVQDKEQNSIQDKEQNSIQDKEQEQQSNQEQSKLQEAEGSIAVANGHNGASLFESNEREVGDGTRPKSGSSQQYQVSPGVPSLQRNPSTTSRGGGHIFSPGPRAPAFRIPEFRWSFLHQKLLSDLLFAVETDIQVWKSHSTKNVIDFVNASENHIYVVNVTHMISQLADNLITSCGGLLPLLAAATSQNGEIEILEPNQGLSIEQAVMILQRIMYMTDILVFASSTNFTELENEKNMPSGGILRQCLRLVCTSAVRNCLECRHRYQGRGSSEPPSPGASKSVNSVDAIQSLIGGSHPSAKNIVENLAGQTTPIKDPEKLLQDMDINRLRAVVYRDVEETKQAQFLALAIVYFCSVLMVSKYRDILEPPSPSITPIAAATPGSKEGSGAPVWQKITSSAMPLLPDSGSSTSSVATSSIRSSDESISKGDGKQNGMSADGKLCGHSPDTEKTVERTHKNECKIEADIEIREKTGDKSVTHSEGKRMGGTEGAAEADSDGNEEVKEIVDNRADAKKTEKTETKAQTHVDFATKQENENVKRNKSDHDDPGLSSPVAKTNADTDGTNAESQKTNTDSEKTNTNPDKINTDSAKTDADSGKLAENNDVKATTEDHEADENEGMPAVETNKNKKMEENSSVAEPQEDKMDNIKDDAGHAVNKEAVVQKETDNEKSETVVNRKEADSENSETVVNREEADNEKLETVVNKEEIDNEKSENVKREETDNEKSENVVKREETDNENSDASVNKIADHEKSETVAQKEEPEVQNAEVVVNKDLSEGREENTEEQDQEKSNRSVKGEEAQGTEGRQGTEAEGKQGTEREVLPGGECQNGPSQDSITGTSHGKCDVSDAAGMETTAEETAITVPAEDTDSTHVNKMDGGESSDEREAGEDEESEDIQDSGTDRAETDSASVSETIPRETNPHQENQAKDQGGQDTSSKQDQQQAASSNDGDPEPAEDAGAASGQGDSASEDNQQDGGKKEEDLEKKKEEDGKKKEEDGKKKEEDGKRKEEDGKRKEEDGKKQEPVKDLREVNVDESKMEDVDLKEDSETRKPAQGATVAEPRPERAEGEESAKPISSISVSHKPTVQQSRGDSGQKASPLELNISPPIHSLATASADSSNLTERLERALGSVAPLLREVFVDFAPFLSKTLIGSHGQELLIGGGGLVTLKQSTSVVELVMLLCSQEWQNSLQKHAGLAFIELVNEGRLLAHATRDHIVRVANEAEFILNRMRAEDVQKHADFESTCAQAMMERREEEKLCDHLIKSAKRRDHSLAVKQRDKILNILLNKHGAWGSNGNLIGKEFWKLDIWEDDSRRRRRMIKNPLGSSHPEATLKAAIEHGAAEDAINAAREAFHTHLASLKKTQRETTDFTDEELVMEEKDVEQEFSGPVAMSTPCKLIAPGVAVNGTMSITKNELYFEMDEEDPQNKKTDSKVLAYVDFLHGKWNFSEVRAIFSRRYLLQNVAIEIFMANRTAVMFAFPDHGTVKKVINALPRVGVGIKYGLQQARRVSMASGKQLFKLSNMTQKWQKREISNFDYIMYLNTIAGRTYNDLNQYPVFPWVLVNYDNDHLDLSSANSYRDLSKPIGALNETRKAYFEERFSSWEHDQIPPFHYGTHYSTSAFTLNWLIRVEPFTTMFLNLQGGKFDHPNRIFSSVSQAWKNCQRDTSDVKELIPEFFCLPEMFSNSNKYSLGKQEDGKVVSDVQLPPWAKTPEEFVRINKMALESEFVSCQIHNWIDLIFGYKQRGPEAVRATNVFYYLTYEGSVNLETMTDPVMKEAIENQIRSFGQTPSQLLTEPHPPRSSVMHLLIEKNQERRSIINKSPMMFSKTQDDVCMIMKFLSNSPVTHVAANTHPAVPVPAITSITCNHNYAINKWNNNYIPQANSASFSSEKADPLAQPNLPLAMDQLLVLNTGLQRRTLGDNFDQRLPVNHHSFVTTADNRFLFACGFWDKSFRVYYLDTARIIQVVFGHFDVVTCVARSECNISQDCYVVTGSKDCTVMVWMFSAKSQAILGDNNSLEMPTPRTVLTGHQSEITCVATIAELGLVVSGSRDGPSLVHSLTGDLLHSLEPPSTCHSPRLIAISREAFIILTYDQGNICMFSINGKMLHFMEHRDNIQTLILSRDGQYMLMGGNAGVVEVWRSYDFSHLYSFPVCDSCIRSLALTHDHRFLIAGLATGCLLVFNIDFNKWHHEFQERYT